MSDDTPPEPEEEPDEDDHFVPNTIQLPETDSRTNYVASDIAIQIGVVLVIAAISYLPTFLLGSSWQVGIGGISIPVYAAPPVVFVIGYIVTEAITRRRGRTRVSYRVEKLVTFQGSRFFRYLFKQSSTLFVLLGVGIPILAFYVGIEKATVATLFYATIILLKEILLDGTAVLRFGDSEYYWRDDDGRFKSFSRLVQNIGSDEASAVTISYRVYDKNGKPLMKPHEAHLPPEYLSLDVGEAIPANEIFVPIPSEVSSDSDTALVVHYRAEDGFGKSLLPARTMGTTSTE